MSRLRRIFGADVTMPVWVVLVIVAVLYASAIDDTSARGVAGHIGGLAATLTFVFVVFAVYVFVAGFVRDVRRYRKERRS